MKKTTVGITILIMAVIVGAVGCYAYFAGKSRQEAEEAALSTVQLALTRDLQNDYPATVKEVVRYYTELQKCFYNEECTDEELEALAMQARLLYDDELLEANEVPAYLDRLRAEVASFRSQNRRITGVAVAASTSVFYFQEDGYSFARIHCGYTISEKVVQSSNTGVVYLLRQDENKRWKIYGWKTVSAIPSSGGGQ